METVSSGDERIDSTRRTLGFSNVARGADTA
jgi:hypothetical protein